MRLVSTCQEHPKSDFHPPSRGAAHLHLSPILTFHPRPRTSCRYFNRPADAADGKHLDAFPETAVLLVIKAIAHPTEERVYEAWYSAHTRDWPAPAERGSGWWRPLLCWGSKR